jgi:hypothetical protein
MLAWRWALLGAVLTLLVGVGFSLVPDIAACGTGGTAGPWVSFQQVRSADEVQQLFAQPCAQLLRPALEISMWLDAIAFIPAYVLFIGGALWTLAKGASGTLRYWAMGGAFDLSVGVIADQVEGAVLLGFLNAGEATPEGVQMLIWAGAIKITFLAFATGVAGALFFFRGTVLAKAFGAIAVLGSAVAVAGVLWLGSVAETGLLIAWVGLLLATLSSALQPSSKATEPT